MNTSDPARKLWEFFSRNIEIITGAYDAGDYEWLNDQLAPLVKAIAEDMNWEMGPYHHPDNTFVLSPTVRENLPLSRAAVAIAPSIAGWHFEPAKPPKDLRSLHFEAEGAAVCADEWRYRLTSYNDGEFVDIELFYEASAAPKIHFVDMFCELVVEALIGEALRLDRVGYLEPKLVEDISKVERASGIRCLKKHLDEVLAPIQ